MQICGENISKTLLFDEINDLAIRSGNDMASKSKYIVRSKYILTLTADAIRAHKTPPSDPNTYGKPIQSIIIISK